MIRAAALILLLAGPAAAAPGDGPRLGERVKVGEKSVIPVAALDLYLKQRPVPGLYRQVAVDWRASVPVGTYPAAAFAAQQQGDVYLSLDVGSDGRPTGCRITRPSGVAALDSHSCAHALGHSLFIPGLDDRGRRVGGTVEGRLSFDIIEGGIVRPALFEGVSGGYGISRQAEPLQPITLDTLGIPAGTNPPWTGYWIRATLATSPKGKVTACLLTAPTFEDPVDKVACDRLRKQRFRPALDRARRPAAGLHFIALPLKR